MLFAVTRGVSGRLGDCALTFLERGTIDVELASRQHREYESCLERLGARVLSLPAEPDLPDSCFVEDTAVVVDEVAVLTAPRLQSRRLEVETVGRALAPYRPIRILEPPASLEGGDVIRIEHDIYVGLSSRTNRIGIEQLASILEPLGYAVRGVEVKSCLHLKTACTYIGNGTLLLNPEWVAPDGFGTIDTVEVAPNEAYAGNALCAGDRLLLPASFPGTRGRLEDRGFEVDAVDVSELQKAEAGLTCCSILFSDHQSYEQLR